MRHSLFRTLSVLLAAFTLALLCAAPAAAEEERARSEAEIKKLLKGLANGIEALEAVGGNKEVIAHMRELMADLEQGYTKRKPRGEKARNAKKGRSEKQHLGNMIELMLMAHHVLRAADRDEHAEVMEHGAHALKMIWSGRKDAEAMEILATAPGKERQVEALFLASEILADQGKKDRAHMLLDLGRELSGKKQAKKGRKERRERPAGEREGGTERAELAKRVEILRMAMPALREGEKRDAAELLERAIHTGELLLEGREDEEAQEVYARTPSLGQLREILHLAAELWQEFKHPDKAKSVMWLSKYYAERAEGGEREERARGERHRRDDEHAREMRREDERRERELRGRREMEVAKKRADEVRAKRLRAERDRARREIDDRDGTERRIRQLQEELNEVRAMLERLMKQLRESARDR